MTNPTAPTGDSADVPLIERLRRSTQGRFEIDKELGSGGMATVFKAREIALDRIVAIKVMSLAMAGTPDALERFRREARVAAALSHPHIVPIFSIGEDPALAYFVMKFIEGRTLDSIVSTDGLQSLDFVRRTFSVVGSALQYAHQHGVVHRDVKPANIMIDREGWTYITDFGIAKRDDGASLTQSGMIIGTPAYMSPEQFNGTAVTGAADQYSLGIVLFELLAGRAPFSGPSLGEIMRGHVLDPVPPLREHRPDLPPTVERFVTRILAKKADERFATLTDAVRAFEAAVAGLSAEQRALTGARVDASRLRAAAGAATTPVPRAVATAGGGQAASSSGPRRTMANRPAAERPSPPARSPLRLVLLLLLLTASGTGLSLQRQWLSLGELLGERGAKIDALFAPSAERLATPSPGAITPSVAGDSLDPAADSLSGALSGSLVQGTETPEPIVRPPLDAPAANPSALGSIRAPTIALPVVNDTEPEPPADAMADTILNPRAARFVRQQRNDRLVAEGRDPIDAGTVSVGSQSLRTVLFVNGRQLGVIGGRGIVPLAVPAGPATIAIRRIGCTAWDTTFVVVAGERYFIGERSPRC